MLLKFNGDEGVEVCQSLLKKETGMQQTGGEHQGLLNT
jgi:hypothetical protein